MINQYCSGKIGGFTERKNMAGQICMEFAVTFNELIKLLNKFFTDV